MSIYFMCPQTERQSRININLHKVLSQIHYFKHLSILPINLATYIFPSFIIDW